MSEIIPKPADRSKNKPIYIVVVEDPENKSKITYYLTQSLDKNPADIDLKGFPVTKAEANKQVKNPNIEKDAKDLINVIIPWHRVIKILNITYKKSQ